MTVQHRKAIFMSICPLPAFACAVRSRVSKLKRGESSQQGKTEGPDYGHCRSRCFPGRLREEGHQSLSFNPRGQDGAWPLRRLTETVRRSDLSTPLTPVLSSFPDFVGRGLITVNYVTKRVKLVILSCSPPPLPILGCLSPARVRGACEKNVPSLFFLQF